MSSLLDNSSSPSEVDSLDLDEVSYQFIFNINHYFDSLWRNKALTHCLNLISILVDIKLTLYYFAYNLT